MRSEESLIQELIHLRQLEEQANRASLLRALAIAEIEQQLATIPNNHPYSSPSSGEDSIL